MKRLYLIILLLVTVLLVTPTLAQENSGIEFTGTVTIIDEATIEVGGLIVDISGLTDIVIEDGMTITISGDLEGTVVIAINVEISEPEATPEATESPEATEEPEVTAEPESSEVSEDDDVEITIVIEGPVESVEANIITIYSFEIELAHDDPRITYIQVGDVLHIKGHHKGHRRSHRGPIVIVAVFFDFVGVDVVVFQGQVWRDYGDCGITPPVWASDLAIHWNDRCIVIYTSPAVPAGCKITGMGGIKCSGRGSGMRGSGMR